MSKTEKAPKIVVAVILLSLVYGMGSNWLANRKDTPEPVIQSQEIEKEAPPEQQETAKKATTLKPTSAAKQTTPQPVQANNDPAKGSFPTNPYVHMMKQMGQNAKPPTGKAAPHPLDPNSPHPFMHPSQSHKLSKALDSIRPGQIEEGRLRKRNLYFEKLSDQLKELQGKQKNQGKLIPEEAPEAKDKSAAPGKDELADGDLGEPLGLEEEDLEEELDEEFEEEFQEEEFEEEILEEEPLDEFGGSAPDFELPDVPQEEFLE